MFQQYNLFPVLTALENVEYALNVKGIANGRARSEAARTLERVGLGDRLDFLPRDLSGGQKQRVAIARAVAPAARRSGRAAGPRADSYARAFASSWAQRV